MIRGKVLYFFSLIAVSLVLSGCGSLFPKPSQAPKLYTLSALTQFPPMLPSVFLAVSHRFAFRGANYNTPQIGVERTLYRIEYFKDIEWAQRLPLLLQNLILKSFENSGAILGVAAISASINPQYLLMVEIREFLAIIKDNSKNVKIGLTLKLVDLQERKIIKSTFINHQTPLKGLDQIDLIPAFNQALEDSLKEIVLWTLDNERTSPLLEMQRV